MNKEALRKKYKSIRSNIQNKSELDTIIFDKIIQLKEYQEADLVLAYVSFKDEVDTIELIKFCLEHDKLVAVPKCEGKTIVFHRIRSLVELEERTFGILEPVTNDVVREFPNSICIVPGIAFDGAKHRIGYGAGFYDRFLEDYHGIKIGLTYRECICEKIDVSQYDINMDFVIHE